MREALSESGVQRPVLCYCLMLLYMSQIEEEEANELIVCNFKKTDAGGGKAGRCVVGKKGMHGKGRQ